MKSILIGFIRLYQMTLSPLLRGCCRFEPSCSAYCLDAIRAHGTFRGMWLGLKRLVRCQPFCASGYDPVPDIRKNRIV